MESSRCCICNRPLTDPKSIRIGIGPDCRSKGHSHKGAEVESKESSAVLPWPPEVMPFTVRNGTSICTCGVTYRSEGKVVVLSELLCNTGPSVTNCIEDLARHFGGKMLVEHYPRIEVKKGRVTMVPHEETFDGVTFDASTRQPKWQRLNAEEVAFYLSR